MDIFEIESSWKVPLDALNALNSQLNFHINGHVCFFRNKNFHELVFFCEGHHTVYVWNDVKWVPSFPYSTNEYKNYFFHKKLTNKNEEEKSSSNESFTLDKMLQTLTEKDWSEFSSSVKEKIIVYLLPK